MLDFLVVENATKIINRWSDMIEWQKGSGRGQGDPN
jgi:hypothetical protein